MNTDSTPKGIIIVVGVFFIGYLALQVIPSHTAQNDLRSALPPAEHADTTHIIDSPSMRISPSRAEYSAGESQNYLNSLTVPPVNSGLPRVNYSRAALHETFIGNLPPAPSGVVFGSEEHIMLYRTARLSQYLASSVTGKDKNDTPAAPKTNPNSQANNPYNKLKEGGILALVGDNIGVSATSESELLAEYRQEKVTQYQSSVIP